jgi:hypothetical protein
MFMIKTLRFEPPAGLLVSKDGIPGTSKFHRLKNSVKHTIEMQRGDYRDEGYCPAADESTL